MEAPLKQRLIGAVVLAALALIFVPMLLKSPDVRDPDRADVPLAIPAEPDADGITTIDIPLDGPPVVTPIPEPAPAIAADSANKDQPANTDQPEVLAPVENDAADQALDSYALMISAGSEAEASTLINALKTQGLQGKVQSNGKAFRIRVGPFASREVAESARLRAKAVSANGTVVALAASANSPMASVPAKPNAALPAAVPAPTSSTAPVAKPVVTPATTAAKPVLPATPVSVVSVKAFAVQIGAPASESAANGLRDKARAAGFASYIQAVQTDSGQRYRVRIGPEADRAAATALMAQIKQKIGLDGIIVQHP